MSYLQIQLTPPQLPPRHLNPTPPPPRPRFTIAYSSNLSDVGLTIIREQQSDPAIQQVMTWVSLGNCPSRTRLRKYSPATRRPCLDFRKLIMVDGVQSKPTFGSPRVNQVIIPLSLQPTVLSLLHGDPLAGHFSSDNTFSALRRCLLLAIHSS